MASSKMVVKLNSGHSMPLIGLGTFRITGRDLIHRVIEAGLAAGYRAIDTAAVYQNEEDIGIALQKLLPKYGLKREDIFLTTKLSPSSQGHDKAVRGVKSSLEKLRTSYLDLCLIHWPGASGVGVASTENAKLRAGSWSALAELHRAGSVRSIGVSNYTQRHLEQLLADCHGVTPAVNQVECHPHFPQTSLLEYCRAKGVLLQAYSSLGASERDLLEDQQVKAVAKAASRSPAQVLLRWALQRGIGVIPKSVTPSRIAENISLDFELSSENVRILDSLGTTRKYAWNPESVA